MRCPHCGHESPEGFPSCASCGAVLHPRTGTVSRPKSAALRYIGLSLILLLGMAAIAGLLIIDLQLSVPELFTDLLPARRQEQSPSGTQTVYVLTDEIIYHDDALDQRKSYSYNDQGLLTEYRRECDGYVYSTLRIGYDAYGNISEVVDYWGNDPNGISFLYDYEYENGLPVACQGLVGSYGDNREIFRCTFHRDSAGRIVLAVTDTTNLQYLCNHIWQYYEYDEAGRLVQETFCQQIPNGDGIDEYTLHRWTYAYNKDGQPIQVDRYQISTGTTHVRWDELDTLDFQAGLLWSDTLFYDRQGRLESTSAGMMITYSDAGTPLPAGGFSTTCDDYGNVTEMQISIRYMDGSQGMGTYLYHYEPLELSEEDAARVLRQKRCPPFHYQGDMFAELDPMRIYYFDLYYDHLHNTVFYYYMIPNPIW